jgi:3-oxoacyl-ACP reductase-like protein
MKKFIVVPLLVLAVAIVLFVRFGYNDTKRLGEFSDAYEAYDSAIASYSTSIFTTTPQTASAQGELESNANQALAELKTKASARISSVSKYDSDMMGLMNEIAGLSEKELDTLASATKKTASLDALEKEFNELVNQRQADFARFKELAGIH